MDKIEYKRIKYAHQGRVVYEWEQSLEEIHCYIAPPPGIAARQLDIHITAKHLRVGIKGNPPFLDVRALPLRPSVPSDVSASRAWSAHVKRPDTPRSLYSPPLWFAILLPCAPVHLRAPLAGSSRAPLVARARAALRVASRRTLRAR